MSYLGTVVFISLVKGTIKHRYVSSYFESEGANLTVPP